METTTKTVRIGGATIEAEAMLNNCAGTWTATARREGRLVATGAGSTPEAALASAIERATEGATGVADRMTGLDVRCKIVSSL